MPYVSEREEGAKKRTRERREGGDEIAPSLEPEKVCVLLLNSFFSWYKPSFG